MAIFNEYINENNVSEKMSNLVKIDAGDIELNQLNSSRQTEENIILIKNSIEQMGLQSPLVVKAEGDHYVLISGEGRYRALEKLNFIYDFNGYKMDGVIPCIIKKEVGDQDEEDVMITAFNAQKDETPKDKQANVARLELRYNNLKAKNQIPTGKTKREWISEVSGYSESSVRDYLAKIAENSEGKQQKQKADKPKATDWEKFKKHIEMAHDIIQRSDDMEYESASAAKELIIKLKTMISLINSDI